MKDVTNIKKVSLTFDELMNCASVPTNRCGYLNESEALSNGFSATDWSKFITRAKKLKKTIEDKGFSKASFFVLAKDENDTIYILDGQGRRKALQMISENPNNHMENLEFICDMYTNPMSIMEMSILIKDMNTGNTNWQTKDIRRSDAVMSDDEEVKIAYAYTKKLMEDNELNDYVVNLLTFGECASHQRGKGTTLSTRNYAITKEVFTEAYLRVVTNASYKVDKSGNSIERAKQVRQKIRNTNFAISFVSCLRNIVKYYNSNIDNAKDDIMYFVDMIIDDCENTDDNYIVQFFKCYDKHMGVVAEKMRPHFRGKCRKSIREALYGNEVIYKIAM